MTEIIPNRRSIKQLLQDQEYFLDYYQREYIWKRENIEDLINDLTIKFSSNYEEGNVERDTRDYEHYYLGTILLCDRNSNTYVVDGQQRITSLTLLLIYLNHLQEDVGGQDVNLQNMILSDSYGELTNNINDEERNECMRSLFNEGEFDPTDHSPSVHSIIAAYKDIENSFPEELKEEALKPFIYWLINNVDLVEIKAFSDDDAYSIFEVMNDRGVSLSSTEMLKGYLLSKANDDDRQALNDFWKNRVIELNDIADGTDTDFFKAWLRSQYAESIRERKKGAENKDFDLIGTKFHNWVKESTDQIGLRTESDYFNFINDLYNKYSKIYLKILNAQMQMTEGLEYIYFNAVNGFTLQPPLLLSAIASDDDEETVNSSLARNPEPSGWG